jgi:hypothetical protein
MEAITDCRLRLALTATLATALSGAIVDAAARISFFAMGDKSLAAGADPLKGSVLRTIRLSPNISCSATAEGDARLVADADGEVWVGPKRPGTAFGDPVAKLAVPRAALSL